MLSTSHWTRIQPLTNPAYENSEQYPRPYFGFRHDVVVPVVVPGPGSAKRARSPDRQVRSDTDGPDRRGGKRAILRGLFVGDGHGGRGAPFVRIPKTGG